MHRTLSKQIVQQESQGKELAVSSPAASTALQSRPHWGSAYNTPVWKEFLQTKNEPQRELPSVKVAGASSPPPNGEAVPTAAFGEPGDGSQQQLNAEERKAELLEQGSRINSVAFNRWRQEIDTELGTEDHSSSAAQPAGPQGYRGSRLVAEEDDDMPPRRVAPIPSWEGITDLSESEAAGSRDPLTTDYSDLTQGEEWPFSEAEDAQLGFTSPKQMRKRMLYKQKSRRRKLLAQKQGLSTAGSSTVMRWHEIDDASAALAEDGRLAGASEAEAEASEAAGAGDTSLLDTTANSQTSHTAEEEEEGDDDDEEEEGATTAGYDSASALDLAEGDTTAGIDSSFAAAAGEGASDSVADTPSTPPQPKRGGLAVLVDDAKAQPRFPSPTGRQWPQQLSNVKPRPRSYGGRRGDDDKWKAENPAAPTPEVVARRPIPDLGPGVALTLQQAAAKDVEKYDMKIDVGDGQMVTLADYLAANGLLNEVVGNIQKAQAAKASATAPRNPHAYDVPEEVKEELHRINRSKSRRMLTRVQSAPAQRSGSSRRSRRKSGPATSRPGSRGSSIMYSQPTSRDLRIRRSQSTKCAQLSGGFSAARASQPTAIRRRTRTSTHALLSQIDEAVATTQEASLHRLAQYKLKRETLRGSRHFRSLGRKEQQRALKQLAEKYGQVEKSMRRSKRQIAARHHITALQEAGVLPLDIEEQLLAAAERQAAEDRPMTPRRLADALMQKAALNPEDPRHEVAKQMMKQGRRVSQHLQPTPLERLAAASPAATSTRTSSRRRRPRSAAANPASHIVVHPSLQPPTSVASAYTPRVVRTADGMQSRTEVVGPVYKLLVQSDFTDDLKTATRQAMQRPSSAPAMPRLQPTLRSRSSTRATAGSGSPRQQLQERGGERGHRSPTSRSRQPRARSGARRKRRSAFPRASEFYD